MVKYKNILNANKWILDFWYTQSIIRLIPCSMHLFLAVCYDLLNRISKNFFYFQYMNCLCWVFRVGEVTFLNELIYPFIKTQIAKIQKTPSILINSYKKSSRAKQIRRLFDGNENSLKSLCGNYIILKESDGNEKGVLLLKYAESFEALIIFCRINEILEKYHLVLEMSWDGVCDPVYFLYLNLYCKVFIEATSESDFEFLENINTNLIPIKLAANDWINAEDIELIDAEKRFDITMVANWSLLKNHRKLFAAVEKMSFTENRKLSVLLIGFPWADRYKEDIVAEFSKLVKQNKSSVELTILEKIPHAEVLVCLQQSKMLVLLTYKEGCNQAISEALVCNTPIIVYKNIKGGALEKINHNTGVVASFENLHEVIQNMLNRYKEYNPREYYLKNSGAKNSIEKLNSVIKSCAEPNWTRNIVPIVNAHGLKYMSASEKEHFKNDYSFIRGCIDIKNIVD
jgi:hypothetical protein